MKRIADALAGLDPLADIVCLQEGETHSIRSTVAPPPRKGEPEVEGLLVMLRQALAAVGKPDTYEAYYFPAHAYQLGRKTHIYTTGLAILIHRDLEIHHHNSSGPHDITYRRIHPVRRLKQ